MEKHNDVQRGGKKYTEYTSALVRVTYTKPHVHVQSSFGLWVGAVRCCMFDITLALAEQATEVTFGICQVCLLFFPFFQMWWGEKNIKSCIQIWLRVKAEENNKCGFAITYRHDNSARVGQRRFHVVWRNWPFVLFSHCQGATVMESAPTQPSISPSTCLCTASTLAWNSRFD